MAVLLFNLILSFSSKSILLSLFLLFITFIWLIWWVLIFLLDIFTLFILVALLIWCRFLSFLETFLWIWLLFIILEWFIFLNNSHFSCILRLNFYRLNILLNILVFIIALFHITILFFLFFITKHIWLFLELILIFLWCISFWLSFGFRLEIIVIFITLLIIK